jgi:protein-L-isoaspartate(D-aspartate) O-methyltransferase
MNFDLLRHKMVIEQLVRRGITDLCVIEAMGRVPREEFVPESLRHNAYDDTALPIGWEQTISQPYTVAYMCQEARLKSGNTVLEVGTGSGYGAAVLAQLAVQVHTVERIDELYDDARARLARLGYDNVRVHRGDGTLGLAEDAPFDAIVVTAGAQQLPEAYLQQLVDGGRLVIPVGPAGGQIMFRLTRAGDQWHHEELGSFGFVPLVSDNGNDESETH